MRPPTTRRSRWNDRGTDAQDGWQEWDKFATHKMKDYHVGACVKERQHDRKGVITNVCRNQRNVVITWDSESDNFTWIMPFWAVVLTGESVNPNVIPKCPKAQPLYLDYCTPGQARTYEEVADSVRKSRGAGSASKFREVTL